VAHTDLKRKNNILVTPDESPYLIDFGTAVVRRADGGALNRWLFDTARQFDLNAWVKHKYHSRFDELTAQDRQYYRPTLIERLIRPAQKAWRVVTARQWRKARKRRRLREDSE
jgi:serine/threonine protein kinase